MDRKEYIKELSNLNSNKYSKNQTINLFFGLMFYLISDKEIFKKNIDIKIFLDEVLDRQYKEYLFRSRPYLISRVLNDIKKERKFLEILKIVDLVIKYLNTNSDVIEKEKKKNEKKIENNIVDWFNQVKNN